MAGLSTIVNVAHARTIGVAHPCFENRKGIAGVEVRHRGRLVEGLEFVKIAITDQVVQGMDPERVMNEAGTTDLTQFMDRLAACRVVICNDTGGMHLANLLGIPVIAIFGPTNPVRTGPVFDAEIHLLQPPGCPATGGAPIEEVSVDRVWQQWEALNHG